MTALILSTCDYCKLLAIDLMKIRTPGLQSRTFTVVSICGILVWIVVVFFTLTYPDDFAQIRLGAVDLIHEDNPYASRIRLSKDFQAGRSDDDLVQGFRYTPVFAYLFRPFGMISHSLGQKLWFIINLISLSIFIALCMFLAPSRMTSRYWGLVVLMMLLTSPTFLSVHLGQMSIVMALLLVGAYTLRSKYVALSALLLALATMMKLYPALLWLYALLRGPRRVAYWTLAMGLLLVAIFLPFYATEHYTSFILTSVISGNHPYAAEFNLSIYGFWTRLLTDTPYAIPLLNAPWLARTLSVICCTLLLVLCAILARHMDDERKRLHEYCLWLCVMLLLSPINGSYNSVLLLLPFLLLVRYAELTQDRMVLFWLVTGTIMAVWPPAWTDNMPLLYRYLHNGFGLLFLTPGIYGILIYCGLLAGVVIRPWPEQQSGTVTTSLGSNA